MNIIQRISPNLNVFHIQGYENVASDDPRTFTSNSVWTSAAQYFCLITHGDIFLILQEQNSRQC